MTRQTARLVLDSMNMRPALIAQRYASAPDLSEVTSIGMLGDIRELAQADADAEQARTPARRRALAAAFGFNDSGTDKPFVFSNGKAIIPVHGMLINRFPYSWDYVTGYNFIRSQVEAALADPDVDGIVYDVNSYGGTVAGCQETADLIYSASQKQGGKPSLAVVDANCYSAAYYLMCGADHISVTPTGGTGSIGVVAMHMDVSKMLDEIGIKITFITAGAHKVDGNPYEPLDPEVTSDIQTEIDKMYDAFVSTVTRGRPKLSDQDVRDTEARCYLAADALDIGLIDSVQVPSEALGFFDASEPEDQTEPMIRPDDPDDDDADPEDREPGDDPEDDDDDDDRRQEPERTHIMPAATATAPALDAAAIAANAASEARTAERARVAGIMAHAEATGREALARHLAMETDMSVEAAGAVLAVSPKAAPAAPAAAPREPTQERNLFREAMNAGGSPNVGADPVDPNATGQDGAGKPTSAANRIIANYHKMAGKPKTIEGTATRQ